MDHAAPQGRVVARVPAVQALIIQSASLALVLLLQAACAYAGYPLGLTMFVLLQGTAAALLARWRRMAPWWMPIHFLFPSAVSATHALALPPSLFLAGFILLLGLYWTTFRTQVPLYLSGRAAWDCVEHLLPQQRQIRFLDIGSGLGGLVLHLARQRPDSCIAGIEAAPLPWLISWLRGRFARNGGRFMHGDYGKLDFSGYDVIFAYLSPAAMPSLWEKAATQMRSGTLLLSYEFSIDGAAPDIEMQIQSSGRMLYGWRM